MENSKLITPNSGHGRLREVVVYERFQIQGFDWKSWIAVGGGRLGDLVAHGGSTVCSLTHLPEWFLKVVRHFVVTYAFYPERKGSLKQC